MEVPIQLPIIPGRVMCDYDRFPKYEAPVLDKVHIADRVERGVVIARCGYFYAREWEGDRQDDGKRHKQGANSDPRVYEHFLKKWPEMECDGCSATLTVAETWVAAPLAGA